MRIAKLKGTYDIPPQEAGFFSEILGTVSGVLERNGYQSVSFPVIENAGLFSRSIGESSDIVVKKEMYVFEDRGHRMVALRPEGTASAVRLYLENSLAMQGHAAKLYYSGPMFRAENPQAGRFRQFLQTGAEYIGDANPWVDAELIRVNRDIFEALRVADIRIFINSIGCRECRPRHLEDLKKYFSGRLVSLCGDCRTRYQTNVLRILDCKEEQCAPVIAGAPVMADLLCGECEPHFRDVQSGLKALGVPFEIDPRLVRGLDYYNRTVFEIKSDSLGALSTVSAGGRYDYLVKELGGMDTPAAGFALGIERLAMAVEKASGKSRTGSYRPPHVYIAFIGAQNRPRAADILFRLTRAGLSAVTEYRYDSLKKHLKAADALKTPFALFVGDDEVAGGRYTLRNLSTGGQSDGSLEDIIGQIQKARG